MTSKYVNGIDTGKSRAVQELIRKDGDGDMARPEYRAAFGLESGNAGFENIRVSVNITTTASKEEVDRILSRLLPTAPIPDTIIRPVPLDIDIAHGQSKEGDDRAERSAVLKFGMSR